MKIITIKYPEFLDDCGECVGAHRQLSNYVMTKNIPKYDRGDQNNSRNQIGVKGELIYGFYLEKINENYWMPSLLGNTPYKGPDFVIYKDENKKYNIDVKASHSSTLRVNKDEHEDKRKGIDYYAFIIITNQKTDDKKMIAKLIHCHYDEVTSWGVSQSKHSSVYQKEINL
jgi:hypothetical protein